MMNYCTIFVIPQGHVYGYPHFKALLSKKHRTPNKIILQSEEFISKPHKNEAIQYRITKTQTLTKELKKPQMMGVNE